MGRMVKKGLEELCRLEKIVFCEVGQGPSNRQLQPILRELLAFQCLDVRNAIPLAAKTQSRAEMNSSALQKQR